MTSTGSGGWARIAERLGLHPWNAACQHRGAVDRCRLSEASSCLSCHAIRTADNISVGLFDDLRVRTHVGGHKVSIDTKGSSDVYVVSNVIAPGGHTGWHTHPGPSLVTVKSGTITAYDGHDPARRPVVYQAGEDFVDAGDGHVHILRNEGAVAAETIAVQLLPHGAVRRIDVPAPGNCPF